MNKLKFAIVGCGRIGNRHAQHISNHGQLLATCDIDKARAVSLSETFGGEPFDDFGEMLSKIEADLVAICTPNGNHFEHTIAALNAGFHVLCEKPMALSVSDCGKMIDMALRVNKRLFVVKQNRFNPPVAAVKKAVDEGKFGKLLSVQLNCFWNRNADYYENSWKGSRELDGGSLFTQFSHFIDLLYWIVGDIKNVRGFLGNYNHAGLIEFEDHGVAILDFYNGCLGTINYTTNAYGSNMEGSLTIFGEKGTVKIGGQYLNELEYQKFDNFEIDGLPPGNPANHYGQYQGSMSNHGEVYANVVETLTGNAEMATNAFEGLKSVEIIDKIYSSSKWKTLED